jgi:hypothetical protein
MPYLAPRPCRQPGCPKTTVERNGFCECHKPVYDRRRYDKNRPTAYLRGYDRHWQALRKSYLRSHPLCVRCSASGTIVPATVVDHVKSKEEKQLILLLLGGDKDTQKRDITRAKEYLQGYRRRQ